MFFGPGTSILTSLNPIETLRKLQETGSFASHISDWVEFIKLVPLTASSKYDIASITIIVKGVFEALLSIGYTLAVFFFLVGFLNKTIMFEFATWENVVKCLLRFVVAKIVLENSLLVLDATALLVGDMASKVDVALAGENVAFAPMANFDAAIAVYDQMNFFDRILFGIKVDLLNLFNGLLTIAIFVVVYGRFLEICVYTMIAPIPLSTLVSEEFSGTARKFFQGYIAVLLQGLMIIVLLFVFAAVSKSFIFGGEEISFLQYSLSGIILLFMLIKSGNWAKQVVGL